MDTSTKKDVCVHSLSVKLRSGLNVVNVKPLFSYDSQNIIIACGTDIRVFAIKSGECTQVLKYHHRPVISLRENKNNILQIFSCSDDGLVVKWDYAGRILQVYDLQMPVANFYVPSTSEKWFVTKKYEDHFRLYSLMPKQQGCSKVQMILKPVQLRENAIGFGFMGKYLASINEDNLIIYKCDTESFIRHKTGDRKLTCVTCHPSEFIVATGDEHGRVIVWSDALDSNHPVRSIYHWHTLPVADLVFSPEGSHLYSGGGEAAIVKWNLFSEERAIMPQLGATIEFVISAKDNSYVVTTHSDNVLQVLDAQRNIVQVIQGLSKSEPLYEKLLPTGLLYDSHLKALVMNGKPGHLQFYDIKQEKQLFNIDIAAKNFFNQERDTAVYNIDIQKAALNDTGIWLATTEFWCHKDFSPHIWLKFWKFDLEKQIFSLNTNVYLPHNKELNYMLFKPSSSHVSDEVLATTSNDGRFKIWILNNNPKDGKQIWNCEYMGYYRNMIPSSTSFSEDGSLLAVAFERVATLWHVDGLSLKAVLVTKKMQKNIKQLLFGRYSGFKYLVCHDGASIIAWDIISLSISWIVHVEVQVLAGDIATDNIAAFCKDQNLKIFKPNSPQPLDYIEKVSDLPIVSAIFVPSGHINNVSGCFQEKSQLFFIDESQNLSTLSLSEEEQITDLEKKIIAQYLGRTPFGMLQAAQTISDIKEAIEEQFTITEQDETTIIPNPTWVDVKVLFNASISKLLGPKIKDDEKKEQENEKSRKSEPESRRNKPKSTINLDVSSEGKELNNKTKSSIFENDWRSKEPRFLDFSFLSRTVRFKE